ncbi:MAG: nucleoside phosphorylase [Actinomycetota bacterium]
MGRDAPILEFDPDPVAVFEPHHVIDATPDAPKRAVLCFFSHVIDGLRDAGAPVLFELTAAHGVHPVYGVDVAGEQIGVFHPGVGAPLAGAFLEEAIAHGCRKFMAVGTAGGLVPELTMGHVVVPTAAIRDEGTSYHYLPPGRSAAPSSEAVRALTDALDHHDISYVTGSTWSTDGFYRETRKKLERRVAQGCLTVEMEASALFAIAQFRGVPLAQVLTTSDDLSGDEWDDSGWGRDKDLRSVLFDAAAEAVCTL